MYNKTIISFDMRNNQDLGKCNQPRPYLALDYSGYHKKTHDHPRLTLSWQALIIFRIFIIETKLDFVSSNDKHLPRRRKFVAERDFPKLNSYTGQVLCLSHSRDQKFDFDI